MDRQELARLLRDGAAFVRTPTLGASPLKLALQGREDACETLNAESVRAVRASAGGRPVAACMGPSGESFAPIGRAVHEELIAMFRRQVSGLLQGDPDFFLLEAFSDAAEARAAVIAVKELCGLPFAVSLAPEVETASRHAAEAVFTALGASAVRIGGGSWAIPDRQIGGAVLLASLRSVAEIRLDGPLCVVGERINPSGKPALAAELRAGRSDLALGLAESQRAAGVHALDVNAGAGGPDESGALCTLVEALSAASPLPLSLDTADPEAMIAAVRLYGGRALMNSVAPGPHADGLLRSAAFYGAVPVLMPVGGGKLPDTAAGRRAVIDQLLDMAACAGYGKTDVLVDCGTPCAALCAGDPAEAVRFVRQMRADGYLTIAGVSNISYGLPNREPLNAAFLAALMQAGLSAAILNPTRAMIDAVAAGAVVRGDEGACLNYLAQARRL